jgi:hypothetical protein
MVLSYVCCGEMCARRFSTKGRVSTAINLSADMLAVEKEILVVHSLISAHFRPPSTSRISIFTPRLRSVDMEA